MKIKKRSILLLILNLVLTLTIFLSEYVYSSYFSMFSWYENCGEQFLIIIMISTPVFLILSGVYHFLNKKYEMTALNAKLPLISLAVFLLPLLLDLSLSSILITIGAILGLCLCVVSLIVLVRNKIN